MNLRSFRLGLALPAAIVTGALLTACGGGSGGSSDTQPTENLTGTAAIGAPIVGATLTAKCRNNPNITSTTSATGSFALTVANADFPCALQVSGGNLPAGIPALYSLAVSSGNTNVTPLTDLALALQIHSQLSQTLGQWFANPSSMGATAEALASASNTLRTALAAAGYTLPANWSAGSSAPFNAPFTPDAASDAFNRLLEALAKAIKNSGTLANYGALRDAMVNGGQLPNAITPTVPTGPTDPTGPTGPTDPTGLKPTGDGSALGSVNGATGTLNGTTRTYTANVGWDTFGGATGIFGAFKPVGESFDGITRWRIEGLPASVGTHRCNSDSSGLLPRVMLMTGGGAGYTSGKCVIEVTSVTNRTITGRFATEMIDLWGDGKTIAGTVTDGVFRRQ